jgi:hypothetical protein
MYYPDLTPYRYIRRVYTLKALNVGWLDDQHPFPKKKASEELFDALFEACLHKVNVFRGYHVCDFCSAFSFGTKVSRHGRAIILGSAEIRVKGKGVKVYAAPNLIYHYVAEHDYDPPQEFIEALLAARKVGIIQRWMWRFAG